MTKSMKEDFLSRVGDVRAGMLAAGPHKAVPMSHVSHDADGTIWFITAHGTGVADAAKAGQSAEYQIADSAAKLYARIDGTLSHVTDRAKLEEVWSPIAGAWFEDGKDDKDVCLVRFAASEADVWLNDGAGRFLYEIAKAHLTDEKPDMGTHGTVTF